MNGRKPFIKPHGVALPEPQKLRDVSQCSILAFNTEVLRGASGACRRAGGKWYRVASEEASPMNMKQSWMFWHPGRDYRKVSLALWASSADSAGHIQLGSCTRCLTRLPHKGTRGQANPKTEEYRVGGRPTIRKCKICQRVSMAQQQQNVFVTKP